MSSDDAMAGPTPVLRHVQCLDARGLHRMAYWEWARAGGDAGRVLVCVHGVSRQGRDFDVLARALHSSYRVVCPDIDAAGLARIADYIGKPLTWRSEDEAADYLWSISRGFGPHTREEWMALTRPMLRSDGERWRLHYDPAIGAALRAITPEIAAAGEAQLWAAYDRIACPTLVLRGADSDVLAAETARAMASRGPRARVHVFEGVGHAPTVVAPEQVVVVREFLDSGA